MNLHAQMSWQAQRLVNLHAQNSWRAQHFVNLEVQISWQAQHFVNLHVQFSWQAQCKMRFREIADERNAVFFNRKGGSEAGKSSFAGHACSNRPSIVVRVFTCFLKCRFRGKHSAL